MLGAKIQLEDKTYWYDTPTNNIVCLPPEGLKDTEFKTYMQENHYIFSDHEFKGFRFPDFTEEDRTKVHHIVINMTDKCNFRCTYCKYSGDYEGVPEHHDESISVELLDQLAAYIKTLEITGEFIVGFYGGEPLMQFPRIRHFVRKLRRDLPDVAFFFSMTTNGSLLGRQEIREFLVENEIYVNISLDGPQESSKYRIFAGGQPAFDIICKNIAGFRAMAPEYYNSHVGYSVVLAPPVDFDKIFEFFASEEIATEGPLFFSGVDGGSNFVRDHQTDENKKMYMQQIDGYRDRYVELLQEGKTKTRMFHVLDGFFNRLKRIHNRTTYLQPGNWLPPVGNCKPGLHKLFVSSAGNFHVCEKMTWTNEIGNLKDGLDLDKINKIQDEFLEAITEHGCNDCPFSRLCSICMAVSMDTEGFSVKAIHDSCPSRKVNQIRDLKHYLRCIQANPEYFNSDYNPYS
ncbi:MAG: radical SAM protein [Acidobacteriota bacterium]|nr:radical SAM protein [Acidobacteriota bacterium]